MLILYPIIEDIRLFDNWQSVFADLLLSIASLKISDFFLYLLYLILRHHLIEPYIYINK